MDGNPFKSFVNCHIVEDWIIEVPNRELLPYPQEKIQKKLYVRKCYQDVLDLLMEQIGAGEESFTISGTPGIGKSLFFVYILYRLIKGFSTETMSFKPNRILYQMGSTFECFDLHNQVVTKTSKFDAEEFVWEQDTFYVIDGQNSEQLVPSCIVLFISSPSSEYYKEYIKQRKAVEWYFPVWTFDELEKCRNYCYPNLPIDTLKKKHLIYGGVARFALRRYGKSLGGC
jgi:hypothetical protein